MMFFVHIAQHHGVRENLVQVARAFEANLFLEPRGNVYNRAVILDDLSPLSENRSGWFNAARRHLSVVSFCFSLCHLDW